MDKRKQQILQELIAENKPITGDRLAASIQVTSRTIRNDLKEIAQLLTNSGAKIISTRSQGYQLEIHDKEKFKQFIYQVTEMDKKIPVEPEDRVHYLVKKFLLSLNYIKIEDLADELYVSTSTLKKDLNDVKDIIQQYDLKLSQRAKYGLKLTGSEKNIRFAISELLFRRKAMDVEDWNQQSWFLPEQSMDLIWEIVLRELRAFDLNLSDIALHNLVVHIAIACKRIKSKHYVENLNHVGDDIQQEKEYEVAKSIIKNMEESLNLIFPSDEILYITMHLLGTRLLLNENQAGLLSKYDHTILKTVKRIIYQVDKRMNLGIIDDKELFAATALHLKPAIHRFQYQMNIRNPMLETIKANYPIAFDAAIIAGKVIEEDFDININENELGYIALHFGAAIERSEYNIKPKRCLVVCTTGMGSSQILRYKLLRKFGSQLNIIGTTELHNIEKYNENEIDFIVSTVPLPDTITIPHVVVSALVDNEFTKIELAMGDYKESTIDKYLKKELIYTNLSFETPKEVITYLGNELIRKGITEEGIIETVMDRERIASTSYGNLVAIPHPIEAKSPNTFWTIATLAKPIIWGKNKVQFVCLLHVADKNKEELKPMYEPLMQIIDSYEIVQKLITATNTETMMNILKKLGHHSKKLE